VAAVGAVLLVVGLVGEPVSPTLTSACSLFLAGLGLLMSTILALRDSRWLVE
jgi:hypothetical protein